MTFCRLSPTYLGNFATHTYIPATHHTFTTYRLPPHRTAASHALTTAPLPLLCRLLVLPAFLQHATLPLTPPCLDLWFLSLRSRVPVGGTFASMMCNLLALYHETVLHSLHFHCLPYSAFTSMTPPALPSGWCRALHWFACLPAVPASCPLLQHCTANSRAMVARFGRTTTPFISDHACLSAPSL